MTDWTTLPLAEVLEFREGPGILAKDFHDEGVPLIRLAGLKSGASILKGCNYLDPDLVASKWNHFRTKAGDVLLSTSASLGEVAVVNGEGEGAVPYTGIIAFRPKADDVDRSFIPFLLTAPSFKAQIEAMGVGSVMKHFGPMHLRKMKVSFPDVRQQRAIAEVLGALDDKIAANTKLAETAHGLLQAAYRGVSIPAGRSPVRVETLVQRLTPNRKFVPDELKSFGDFPVFDQSESGFLGYLDGDDYLDASPDDPVLYFGDHTCQLRISSEKFTVGPNTVPFKGMGIPTLTLYCAISGLQRHEEYKRHWQLLMKKEICLPDEAAANKFARMHAPLLTMIKEVREENETLAATRDTLLPQLMSGKLRVKDIENTMGEMV